MLPTICRSTKAYIPLQSETTCVTYTDMLVSKMPMRGLAHPMLGLEQPMLGLAHPRPGGPNARPGGPNVSQWNVVSVGYARVWFALAMYFSCYLCNFSHIGYVKITQRERGFWWNTGFRYTGNCFIVSGRESEYLPQRGGVMYGM